MDTETRYAIALSYAPGIGPLRYKSLYSYFGSNQKMYHASKDELISIGLGAKISESFSAFKKTFSIDRAVEQLEKKQIWVITQYDREYPEALKEIPSCPFILFGFGDKSLLKNSNIIAVVGTRKPSAYGKTITRNITEELVQSGWTIISGMAMGIDGIAHLTALDLKGDTIAVLGCGIDICYPAIHRNLYERLKRNGAIISEYPPGTTTSKGIFPSRNRIVAGIAKAVLVTEGTKNSGSLITASYAVDFNRDVFTVPGQVTQPESQAPLYLLRNGAKPVASASDINEEYNIKHNFRSEKNNLQDKLSELSAIELQLFETIEKTGKIELDELTRIVSYPVNTIMTTMTTLQIKGFIIEESDNMYSLAR